MVKDHQDLVDYMRAHSYGQESTNDEYMKNYAVRAVINKNEDIRAAGVTEFVEDLLKYKHIIVE